MNNSDIFVLVEIVNKDTGALRIKRIMRVYAAKAIAEDAVALLRDAFAPDHERQFDLLTVEYVD